MGQPIRTLKKAGARNKEINDSVKETMAMILQNREIKKKEEEVARQARAKLAQESNSTNSTF